MPIPTLAIEDTSGFARDRKQRVSLFKSGAVRTVPMDNTLGWLIEENTQNVIANPHAFNDLNNINATGGAGATISRAPNKLEAGTVAVDVVCAGNLAFEGVEWRTLSMSVAGPRTYCGSIDIYNPTAAVGVLIQSSGSGGGAVTGSILSVPPSPVVKRITLPLLTVTAGTISQIWIKARLNAPTATEFWVGKPQIEEKTYPTTHTPEINPDGSLKPAYTWTGPAHASASNRQAAVIQRAGAASLIGQRGEIVARVLFTGNRNGVGYVVNIGSWQNSFIGMTVNFLTFTTYYFGPTGAPVGTGVLTSAPLTIGLHTLGFAWDTEAGTAQITVDGTVVASRTGAFFTLAFGATVISLGTASNQDANLPVGPVLFFDRWLSAAERTRLAATPTALLGWDTLIDDLGGIAMGQDLAGISLARLALPDATLRRVAVPDPTLTRREPAPPGLTRRGS